jgi:hypothetical protein
MDERTVVRIAEVFGVVQEEARWPTDIEQGLPILLRDAIISYGITCDGQIISSLGRLYDHCMAKLSEEVRMQVFRAVQAALMEGYTTTNALFPMIFNDTSAGIVASAALDYAVLHPAPPNDPFHGARLVASWIREGNPANRAAVFAGLVNLGDRRLSETLDELRACLSVEQAMQVARTPTGYPTLGAFEFWLRWADDALDAGLGATNLFAAIASGLVHLLRAAQVPTFADVERAFGYKPQDGEPGLRILEQIPLSEVAKRFGPRMYALEAAEPAPKIMSAVLGYYGLEPRAAVAERGTVH